MATTTTQKAFNTQKTYTIAGFVVDVNIAVSGDDLRIIAEDIVNAVNEPYRKISKDEIRDYYETYDKVTPFTVIADKRSQTNVTIAKLNGSIIESAVAIGPRGSRAGSGITASRSIAGPGGKLTPQQLADIQRAYSAAMAHYKAGIRAFFRPTGAYEKAVLILQNGKKVGSPSWKDFRARSNITITPYGRKYANPLEVMKNGALLYGAAKAARAASVNVVTNFSYRSGRSLGLSGSTYSGSFPVLEIGLRGSTVRDSITPPGQSRRKVRRRTRRRRK